MKKLDEINVKDLFYFLPDSQIDEIAQNIQKTIML